VRAIAPLKAGKGGAKFGHGLAPANAYEGFAVATERIVGKGKVIYVAMPAFSQYWLNQNPYVAKLIFGLIDRLLPDPSVRVETRAQVEMVALRKGNDLIVHLVNHSGRERLLGYWSPLIEYMPEIRDIPVSIRIGKKSPAMAFAPSGVKIQYERKDGYASFSVPSLHFMESIRVAQYFA
jgi:hypothetical protein